MVTTLQLVVSYGCDDTSSRAFVASLSDVVSSMVRAPPMELRGMSRHCTESHAAVRSGVRPQIHVADVPEAVEVIPTGAEADQCFILS